MPAGCARECDPAVQCGHLASLVEHKPELDDPVRHRPTKFRARLKPNWGDTSGIPLGTPPCNLPKSRQSATCHTIWSKYDKGSFRSLSTDIQSVACRVPCIPSPARVWLVIPWGSRYESTDCPMCEAHMKQLNNNNNNKLFTCFWRELIANTTDYDYKSSS